MGLQLKELLRSICCSNRWLYAVLWRNRSRDSMLLMPEDAYCDEKIALLIEKTLQQVHVVGEGIIGQVAYSGKHRWISLDAHFGEPSQGGLVESQSNFQDTAEWSHQSLAGIKTIALVPVSSQSVLQFGSNQKMIESLDFVHYVRSMCQQLGTLHESVHCVTNPNALDGTYDGMDENFASLFSSTSVCSNYMSPKYLNEVISKELIANPYCPSISVPSCPLPPGLQPDSLRIAPLAQVILQSPNNQPHRVHKLNSVSNHVGLNAWSSGLSSLSSIEQQLLSTRGIEKASTSTNSSNAIIPADDTVSTFHGKSSLTGGLLDSDVDVTRNSGSVEALHKAGQTFGKSNSMQRPHLRHFPDESASFSLLPGECKLTTPTVAHHPIDILSNSTPLEQVNACLRTPQDGDALQALDALPPFSELVGLDSTRAANTQNAANSSFCNLVDPLLEIYGGRENSFRTSDDLFDSLGDLSQSQHLSCWDDILQQVGSGNPSNLSTSMSECVSEKDVGSANGSKKGLFSDFGLDHLLDAVVSNVDTSSIHNLDEHSTITTITRAGSCSSYPNQFLLSTLAGFCGSVDSFNPQHNSEKALHTSQKDTLSKSAVSSWISGDYGESGVTTQPKQSGDSAKTTRKRARPGESTRPRPKDRQLIQDRVKELREIVPNGAKCSIDALLDRTIKHMLFLQSVTKYADKLKQVEEPKIIDKESGVVLKDNSGGSSGGATWAFEVGGQTMVCPIIVEDLNPPGQMLVEMLCEKRGFFLEIAEIIRGFGLTILKGIMEARDDKIWARFVVEANREITRMDIFLSLVQLLQQTTISSTSSSSPTSKATDGAPGSSANKHQQPPLPLPIGVGDRLQ